MHTTIDRFGRMVLPKAVRDGLGLEPGDRLEVSEDGDAVVLRPVRARDSLVLKAGVLLHSGKATGDVVDAVRAHRDGRSCSAWLVPRSSYW
jgi:AbrB family looped-hinge helix DNA binding protein